jgi:hypothetical protein
MCGAYGSKYKKGKAKGLKYGVITPFFELYVLMEIVCIPFKSKAGV